MIYPVDSVIHLLNNRGLLLSHVGKDQTTDRGFNYVLTYRDKSTTPGTYFRNEEYWTGSPCLKVRGSIFDTNEKNTLYATRSFKTRPNNQNFRIDHSTVLCSVTRPWIIARLELTLLWYKPRGFCYVNHVIAMLTSFYLHKKSNEVCVKARSTPVSLLFKGLVTEHKTVNGLLSIFTSHMPRSCGHKAKNVRFTAV